MQYVDSGVAFARQMGDGLQEFLVMLPDDLLRHATLGAGAVMRQTRFNCDIEDESYDRHSVGASHAQQRTPRRVMQIGRVNDRQTSQPQTDARDVMQKSEGRRRHRLITLVIAEQRAATVGGDDFSRQEMARGES